jgi:hypothetical protein
VTRLALSTGADFVPSGPIELDNDVLASSPTWAHLAADAAGVPSITITGGPDLSTVAAATADFRDQYYGLEGCLIEDAALDLFALGRARSHDEWLERIASVTALQVRRLFERMLAAGPAVAITGNVRPAMREQAARLLAVRNP